MKLIPLTRGQFAIVDDEDYDYLMQWKWHAWREKPTKTFYATRSCIINGVSKTIYMHRLIMKVSERKIYVDHIEGNGLDNRKSFLRPCTHSQNNCNRKARIGSSSKYLGVCWDKSRSKWHVKITINSKLINLGRFKNEVDAAFAYNEAALKYHGEFARPNKI